MPMGRAVRGTRVIDRSQASEELRDGCRYALGHRPVEVVVLMLLKSSDIMRR